MFTKIPKILILLVVCYLLHPHVFSQQLHAQNENFVVKRASFSSQITDDFSPVYYMDGLVFCSNRGDNSIIGYNENQKGLYKILYVKKTNSGWKQPELLAGELTTFFNDGPASINSAGNTAWFSRNNRIEKVFGNVNDTTNKLGIFSAEFTVDKWTNIKPFAFDDPRYNYTTPALSPDETRLFFSSDKPGGYGGMDLYYSERKDSTWNAPVNMGPLVNTFRSESFPFAAPDGKLFFSSDGLPGFGGKDIFYTQQINGTWITPVHLDSAINSIADDFGLTTDSTFEQGYFSSNRMKTDDIFSFQVFQPQFSHCDTIKENNYCFTFFDERQQQIDTVPVIYNWDFGDGKIRKGKEVKYCFPGAGEYTVKLTIMDAIEGKAIADKVEYLVNLEEIQQALIHSDNIGLINQPMSFQSITTLLPDFTPKGYFWNYGDGFRPGGPHESKVFGKKGEYTVQLGLWGQKDSLDVIPEKCYLKNVRIFNSFEQLDIPDRKDEPPQIRVFLMDDLSEYQKVTIKDAINTTQDSHFTKNTDSFFEPDSLIMDEIARLLLADGGLRLETRSSEKLSQELSFYFRNKAVSRNSFHCSAGDLVASPFKSGQTENKSDKMIVEFIFMKNNVTIE